MPKTMTKFDRLKSILSDNYDIVHEFENQLNDVIEDFDKYIEDVLKATKLEKGQKRGLPEILEKNEVSETDVDSSVSDSSRKRHCSGESIIQDNATLDNNILREENGGGRSKRNASKMAEARISKQINTTLSQKLRRPDTVKGFEVQIKQEKISLLPVNNNDKTDEFLIPKALPKKRGKVAKNDVSDSHTNSTDIVIKKEKEDVERVPRKLRSQSISENTTQPTEVVKTSELNHVDDEDVMQIETTEREVVTLSDCEDEQIDKNKQKKKSSIIDKSMTESSEKDLRNNDIETQSMELAHEDQVTSPGAFPIQPCSVPLESLNSQQVHEGHAALVDNIKEVSKILSDATNNAIHSNEVLQKEKAIASPEKKSLGKNTNKNKNLLFNPLDSVKKKVEALEKLNSTPVRVTRTKTKALKNVNQEYKENVEKGLKSSNMKLEHQTQNTMSDMNSFQNKQACKIVTKPDSREKQEDNRKKLDTEAQKKREALIQAKVEEKKKKREERALRVQKLKEQKEQERLLQIKERELKKEALMKELERKRMLAAKTQKVDKTKLVKKDNGAAQIVKTKTVLDINTDDDTDEEENTKREIPDWSTSKQVQMTLDCEKRIPENIISSLFSSKPTRINLKHIFPQISSSQLNRRSSAIWSTPPRYSQIPKY